MGEEMGKRRGRRGRRDIDQYILVIREKYLIKKRMGVERGGGLYL